MVQPHITGVVPILRATKIVKSFGRTRILNQLDVSLHPHMITVLRGDNGSGRVYALEGRTGAKKWEAFIGFDGGRDSPDFLAIGKNATLYARTAERFYSLKTDDQSSGSSPWPMFGQNAQHTGRAPK